MKKEAREIQINMWIILGSDVRNICRILKVNQEEYFESRQGLDEYYYKNNMYITKELSKLEALLDRYHISMYDYETLTIELN